MVLIVIDGVCDTNDLVTIFVTLQSGDVTHEVFPAHHDHLCHLLRIFILGLVLTFLRLVRVDL